MSIADNYPQYEENLLIDRETLANNIGYILDHDPDAPDILARLFVELRRAIDGGLQGISRARNTLITAVEMAYLHSHSHVAALTLYRLAQEGQLKVEDEPIRLINAAIERNAAGKPGRCAPKRAGR
ncbi:MAG TPA: hypothetical protein VEZ40_01410 [Pyrinomonadaceae bacterium]|nr:hypothetical protein [Pyrinomonadaceae bacterium]